jgi:hypothetical protein
MDLIFYTIAFNWTLNYKSPYMTTLDRAYPKDDLPLRLKVSIDNALIEIFTKNDIQKVRSSNYSLKDAIKSEKNPDIKYSYTERF